MRVERELDDSTGATQLKAAADQEGCDQSLCPPHRARKLFTTELTQALPRKEGMGGHALRMGQQTCSPAPTPTPTRPPTALHPASPSVQALPVPAICLLILMKPRKPG